ncbi:MAG TPA: hypothetical protein VJT73_17100, partial [Polyangiaceae bacterium]|nr:hypothetical protein [Polyangiaceae bacterium]
NPIFYGASGAVGAVPSRDASLVYFAAIVGVPWQDIARDANDLSQGFFNAKELVAKEVWRDILGAPNASPPIAPRDPHMVVSPLPRPFLPGPEAAPLADEKHGHEWNPSSAFPDLQYACTFPLPETRDCDGTKNQDCDCANGNMTQSPLCQNPTTGAYGTTQYRAKAYPAVRELQVLQGIGEQGIVASICPANVNDPSRRDYGYRPAVDAIVERLRGSLRQRCLPRTLLVDGDGSVRCVVVEAFTPEAGQECRCDDPRFPGRTRLSSELETREVLDLGSCACEIARLEGNDRARCLDGTDAPGGATGWCYVDPNQTHDPAQCALVAKCPTTDRRIIRYVGAQPRGKTLVMCQEQSFVGDAPEKDVCPR